MTSAQVVETSVTNNSSFQNYPHPDDHTIRTTDTPGFKPFTMIKHSYSRYFHGHNLHHSITVLCTLLPISFFPSDNFFNFFKVKEDNTYMYTVTMR